MRSVKELFRPDSCTYLYPYLLFQYITWINDGKTAWTMTGKGMAADPAVEISARPIPQEPMVSVICSVMPSYVRSTSLRAHF